MVSERQHNNCRYQAWTPRHLLLLTHDHHSPYEKYETSPVLARVSGDPRYPNAVIAGITDDVYCSWFTRRFFNTEVFNFRLQIQCMVELLLRGMERTGSHDFSDTTGAIEVYFHNLTNFLQLPDGTSGMHRETCPWDYKHPGTEQRNRFKHAVSIHILSLHN